MTGEISSQRGEARGRTNAVAAPNSGVGSRKRRKEARPGEIAAAALEVFAARGFAAARVEDVAARAGVSKGTVYLYFPSKAALFQAVVRGSIVPGLAAEERRLEDLSVPAPAALAAFLRHAGRLVADPRIAAIPKLVLTESRTFPDIARFYLDEVIHRAFALVAEILRRGMREGAFRAVDAALAVRTLIAPVLLIALWRSALEPAGAEPLDAQALIEHHIDLALAALSIEPGAAQIAQTTQAGQP